MRMISGCEEMSVESEVGKRRLDRVTFHLSLAYLFSCMCDEKNGTTTMVKKN